MKTDKSLLATRIANESDWQRIIDIYNQSVLDLGKTADTEKQSIDSRIGWLMEHSHSKHPIILALYEDHIVGWCSLSPHRPGRKALEKTAEISYYVDKQYQGKGIGTYLISDAINYAKKSGIKNLYAILLDINLISINILVKFGFEKWGHLPNVAEINDLICGQFIYGKHLS